MSKFKVGDRVIVNGYGMTSRSGIITECCDHGCMVDSGEGNPKPFQSDDYSEFHLFFGLRNIQYTPTTHTLTPGQTYTSANGNKWECIYTRGDKAWLVSVYAGEIIGSAYDFDLDGTASWAGECSRDKYNIVFEPVLEEWVDYADTDHGRVYIEYTFIDGKPDWKNAKVTPV